MNDDNFGKLWQSQICPFSNQAVYLFQISALETILMTMSRSGDHHILSSNAKIGFDKQLSRMVEPYTLLHRQ
jgi:hypothetical protein